MDSIPPPEKQPDPQHMGSTPASPEEEYSDKETGRFRLSSVQPTESTQSIPSASLHARHPLNRGIRSYLLYLACSPKNLLGRLLLHTGASTDEALMKAVRDGHWQIIPELLDNLSNPREAVRQALYTSVLAQQPESIVHLHRLSGIELEEDYYRQLVEKITTGKERLSDQETGLIASLYPKLTDGHREELQKQFPELSSETFHQHLAPFFVGKDRPSFLTAAIESKLGIIRKALQLNRVTETPEEEKKTFEFLIKYSDKELISQWLKLHIIHEFFLPEQFLTHQASDTQLLFLFSALKDYLINFCNVLHIKNSEVLIRLTSRFPGNYDLKIARLCCIPPSNPATLAEDIYNYSFQQGNYNDCTIVINPSFLSYERLSEIASEMMHQPVSGERNLRSIFNYLHHDFFDAKSLAAFPLQEPYTEDPLQKIKNVLFLCAYSTKCKKNEDKAQFEKIFSKWISFRLASQDYFSLYHFLNKSNAFAIDLNLFDNKLLEHFFALPSQKKAFRLYRISLSLSRANSSGQAIEKFWQADPVWMSKLLFSRIQSGNSRYIDQFDKQLLITLFKKTGKCEELLCMQDPEALDLMRSDPDLATINFNPETVENGAVAECYANIDSAKSLIADNFEKGIACALLYANKLYPKFSDKNNKEPIIYPVCFDSGHSNTWCKKLFHHHLSYFCSYLVDQISTIKGTLDQPSQINFLKKWLHPLKDLPKARMDWVFNAFFDAFEQHKRHISPEKQIRCDWFAGCFEYVRTQIDSDLISLTLKTYLQQPVEQWLNPDDLPGEAKPRLERLRHWRQSPFTAE